MTLNSDATETQLVPPGSDEDPDDSSYGWVMFVAFTTAVLAITFAICALAVIGSWWMLGVVYGADLAITALVMRVVYGAFRSPAYPDLERIESASRAELALQRTDLDASARSGLGGREGVRRSRSASLR